MLGTYGSALLMTLAAVLIGRGICSLAGHDGSSWLSPAVGFAALMTICRIALRLPGRGWTAVGVVVVVSALALWLPARRRTSWPAAIEGIAVGLAILGFVSLPFLANDRIGILGVSLLNDTHWHLLLAEGLRRPDISAYGYGVGYPLGPHAVAATFAQLLGSDVDKTLTGVLIATPVLTGLTALGLLGDLRPSRRWLVAVLAGIPYLAAAWYIESAFKEPILALLLLGLVVALKHARADNFARPAAVAVPVSVLTAGVLYDYSYPGLVWVLAVFAGWIVLELVIGGAWRRWKAIVRWTRRALPGLGVALLLFVVLVAPEIGQIHAFWVSNGGTATGSYGGIQTTGPSSLANLAAPLRAAEGLNVWLSGDFRFVPPDALKAGLLVGFALVVLIYAIVVALERRDLVWVGAMLGLGLVYLYTRHSQSPYVAAKALMIPGPLLVAGSGAALMRQFERPVWLAWRTAGFAAAAIVFFVFSFQSSYLVLSDGFVDPINHISELRSLRRYLQGRQTLALFYDDYIQWELLGQQVSSPLVSGPIGVGFNPSKPWSFGQPIDFDSVDAATLDRFEYVITTRTYAQSQPPPNFQLVATSQSYEVWRRIGATPSHELLPESGAPGAILKCRTDPGRRIARQTGYAMVRTPPRTFAVAPLATGGSESVTVTLPRGEWELSLPFTSHQTVTVTAPGLNVRMPPNLDRAGEIWRLGDVESSGRPFGVIIRVANPGIISSGAHVLDPESLIAVPPRADVRVLLHAACGKYVDWYAIK